MRNRIALYVIIVLAAIGILQSWRHLLIPILVFGTVAFFLIFPPEKIKAMLRNTRTAQRNRGRRVKKAKFRVIPGSRQDDDERPRYH